MNITCNPSNYNIEITETQKTRSQRSKYFLSRYNHEDKTLNGLSTGGYKKRSRKLVNAGFEGFWNELERERICKQRISESSCSRYKGSEKLSGPGVFKMGIEKMTLV